MPANAVDPTKTTSTPPAQPEPPALNKSFTPHNLSDEKPAARRPGRLELPDAEAPHV
jgi:hypothetical protein